jgi:hypothetical protein
MSTAERYVARQNVPNVPNDPDLDGIRDALARRMAMGHAHL